MSSSQLDGGEMRYFIDPQVSKVGKSHPVIKWVKIPSFGPHRYAKMLCVGRQGDCLEYVIALVAALTVREIFSDGTNEFGKHADQAEVRKMLARITQLRRSWAGQGEARLLGDLMVFLRAVGASEYAGCTEQFCRKNGLHHKGMVETRKLRAQLTNSVNLVDEKAQVRGFYALKPAERNLRILQYYYPNLLLRSEQNAWSSSLCLLYRKNSIQFAI